MYTQLSLLLPHETVAVPHAVGPGRAEPEPNAWPPRYPCGRPTSAFTLGQAQISPNCSHNIPCSFVEEVEEREISGNKQIMPTFKTLWTHKQQQS